MSDPKSDTDAQKQEVANLILKYLATLFGDKEIYALLQPLMGIVVEVGVQQGAKAAVQLLEGLAADNSYPYWQWLIAAATPNERVEIMETARQAAIRDRLREMQAREQWKAIGRVILQVAIGIATLLL